MATIDKDPTSAGFNCYTDVTDADAYHDTRLHNSVWTSASVGDKTKALLMATRLLDTRIWKGSKTSGTQNLQFPRTGLSYYDNLTLISVSDLTVPVELANATAELGMFLIADDTTSPSGLETFKSMKVDTIAMEMNTTRRDPSWFNEAVQALVWRFLQSSGSRLNVSVERV